MITRYVNTASTAGGNGTTRATSGANRAYATLRAALTALEGLGALSDAYTIQCEGTAADTTPCNQFDVQTSAANYLLITTTPEDKHAGVWNTSKYRLAITNEYALYNNATPHLRIHGLQVQVTVNDASEGIGIKLANANLTVSGVDLRCSNCIVRLASSNGNTYGIWSANYGGGGSGTSRVWNCLVYGGFTYGTAQDAVSHTVLNCTFHGSTFNVMANAAFTAINCLGAASSSADFQGSLSGTTKNNASSDATATGTNSRINQTFTFVNSGAEDFHLAANDAGARTFGFTDPGSGLFSDDIDEVARFVPWDIGADQTVEPFYTDGVITQIQQPILVGFAR